MCPNDVDRMTNSINPDQSDLGLCCLPRPVCLKTYDFILFAATEIQNIQIADGDVCRGLSIPIFMIFPRLFTCPTLTTNNFKVGK